MADTPSIKDGGTSDRPNSTLTGLHRSVALVRSASSWRKRSSMSLLRHLVAHPLDPAIKSMASLLVNLSRELRLCRKPKVCQRRNARMICMRASQLSPLFEEVRDSNLWLPPSAIASFWKLRDTFRAVKGLIHDCRYTSDLVLLMELRDPISARFRDLTGEIAESLASLPCDLLDISAEVKEQILLVERQAARAAGAPGLRAFVDPGEVKLKEQILAALDDFEGGGIPDPDRLQYIFRGLHFDDVTECERELSRLEKHKEKLKGEKQFDDIPNINSLISFVRYARCVLYGLGPDQQVAAVCRRYDLSSPSMRRIVLTVASEGKVGEGVAAAVPDDFRCPISLDIMVDPVAIASGHSYERAPIVRWMEEGRTTCPKTGSKLLHTHIIPNHNLRRLIAQWCSENDYELETAMAVQADPVTRTTIDNLPNTRAALEATKLTAKFLVEKLLQSESSAPAMCQAAYELRLMAKEGMENRACVAEAGAIPALAALLQTSSDEKTQEHAVTALLNLSINEKNKDVIMATEGAVETIVKVLVSGDSAEARQNAAATLFSLTATKDYRIRVGGQEGVIEGLLEILRVGKGRAKQDAASTLFNIALHDEHAAEMQRKGVVSTAIQVVIDEAAAAAAAEEGEENVTATAEIVSLLAVLSRKSEGLVAVISGGIWRIADELVQLLMETRSNRTQEHTVALLVAACSHREAAATASKLRQKLRRSGSLVTTLRRLLAVGTPRAQRKAATLLRLLHDSTPHHH